VTLDPSKLSYQTAERDQYKSDRAMSLGISIPLELAAPLANVIAQSKTFQQYRKYQSVIAGYDRSSEGVSLYGNMQALLKSGKEIEKAGRILSSKAILVEVFEGTSDELFYDYSWKDAEPVLDAKNCDLNLNNPLWTFRVSANGESFELPYMEAKTVVSAIYWNGIGKTMFPNVRYVRVQGVQQCLQLLKRMQSDANTYEILYEELAVK
jgi:hypothetical protein